MNEKEIGNMKRILSIVFAVLLTFGVLTFAGCMKGSESLRLGQGVYTSAAATDATEDKNGEGQTSTTVASVLVDANGKIVKCFLDCVESTVSYTADGKGSAGDSFPTKYEQGDAYNMVEYGKANREWYAQADAFCALVAGKTVSEVKALVASDNKGTEEVIRAGCTIEISDFVRAIEKAVASAVATDDDLK
jgi:hypothetical protein